VPGAVDDLSSIIVQLLLILRMAASGYVPLALNESGELRDQALFEELRASEDRVDKELKRQEAAKKKNSRHVIYLRDAHPRYMSFGLLMMGKWSAASWIFFAQLIAFM
jgi:hypothetical protein